MKNLLAVLVVIGLVVAGYYTGFNRGKDTGYSQAWDSAYNLGHAKGKQDGKIGMVEPEAHDKVVSDYNNLVNQYNDLLRYANTPRYQPVQPITCNSYDWGSFATTNCY